MIHSWQQKFHSFKVFQQISTLIYFNLSIVLSIINNHARTLITLLELPLDQERKVLIQEQPNKSMILLSITVWSIYLIQNTSSISKNQQLALKGLSQAHSQLWMLEFYYYFCIKSIFSYILYIYMF